MTSTTRRLTACLLGLCIAAHTYAQDSTYTDAELDALDRALAAGNLTRADLTFRKDVTKGHGCFPVVREMLSDPLSIARKMDGIAAQTKTSPLDALLGAAALYEGGYGPTAERRVLPTSGDLPTTPEALLDLLTEIASRQPPLAVIGEEGEDRRDTLRHKLPEEMAWHEELTSPFDEGTAKAIDEHLDAQSQSYLHELATQTSAGSLTAAWIQAFGDPGVWLPQLAPSAFPTESLHIRETRYGRVAIGTPGDDVWTGDFAVLIDPGGNDRYVGTRIGAAFGTADRRVGLFADLAGDDAYDCAETNITLGAAVLGIAAFYDLGAGDDRYDAGHCTLGAAAGGVAVFHDDGGTDLYRGRTYTQGAAGFGIAVFHDGSSQAEPEMSSDEGTKEPVEIGLFDNDRLSAWGNAQAFARPYGVALCINERGNEIYEAGGVYLHAPLFADRYQSFSQGFAIGSRGIDYAGGIAMLVDHDGNDRYLGDIYNQGVGYWYGAGLLWDGGGNDTYEMTQYGQGSGIHLAIGGLVDVDGHDTYVMHSGLGQGGSHDYAASVLHDRGGNDRYHGNTSCNGSGLTNSVGLHIDRAGNDTYAARKKSGVNFGRPARDFGSIGVLVDLDGQDDYLGDMSDGAVWRHTDIGVGIDVTAPKEEGGGGNTPAADQATGAAEIPAICSYEGDLTQEVFDELWEIAVRWEVGDNRTIVPEARKRLIAFGASVVPYMDAKVETDNSGLELRAFVGILRGLIAADAREPVLGLLRTNTQSGVERRQRVAIYLVGELKTIELEDAVVALLSGDDDGLARRAAGVLAKLESHAGDAALAGWLRPGPTEGPEATLRMQAAISTLVKLDADVYEHLRPLLAHADYSIRSRLVTLLARKLETYRAALAADLVDGATAPRTRRSLLAIYARTKALPSAAEIAAVEPLLQSADAGIRADAARVVRRWATMDGADTTALAVAVAVVTTLAEDDPDPAVRFAARAATTK